VNDDKGERKKRKGGAVVIDAVNPRSRGGGLSSGKGEGCYRTRRKKVKTIQARTELLDAGRKRGKR